MDAIEVLQEEVDRLRAELWAAEGNLRNAKELKTGISAGDIVMYRDAEYRVTGIRLFASPKPWLNGVKKLKSGNWGTQVRCLYSDWTKP